MLVLGRIEGQRIIATVRLPGADPVEISIEVCEIRGGKVRIGIDAPRELVEIEREELYLRRQAR